MFAILLVSSRSRERRINQTRLYSDNHYFDEYKMDIYPFQGRGLVRVTFGQFDIICNSSLLNCAKTFEINLVRK